MIDVIQNLNLIPSAILDNRLYDTHKMSISNISITVYLQSELD